MPAHRIYSMSFASIHRLYVAKAEKKGRTRAEVDEILRWQTGYDPAGLKAQIEAQVDVQTFYAEAPRPNPSRSLITGVVCGVRVEDVEDPLMQKIRYLDKLVDELARGRSMDKVLRA